MNASVSAQMTKIQVISMCMNILRALQCSHGELLDFSTGVTAQECTVLFTKNGITLYSGYCCFCMPCKICCFLPLESKHNTKFVYRDRIKTTPRVCVLSAANGGTDFPRVADCGVDMCMFL